MKSKSIIPVITLWEEFNSKHPDSDIQDFARWVLNKSDHEMEVVVTRDEESSEIAHDFSKLTTESNIVYLIQRLQCRLQKAIKPPIKKLGFSKDHEFAMLYHVFVLQSPNKKELAQHMLIEKTTAVEISNRLLARSLVTEAIDNTDKRSTRLKITETGMQILRESYLPMKDIPYLFLTGLTAVEKQQLNTLLKQLNQLHNEADPT
jgi:MarR family transcriptional regulator, lower aerobic nicotinate degradation pathway regulator